MFSATLARASREPNFGLHTDWLPLVDEFRTLNWVAIKRDLEFSKIFEMFSIKEPQNQKHHH